MNDENPSYQHGRNDGSGPFFQSQYGDQHIHLNEVKNHLENGRLALKGRLYPKAVAELEESLSDARKATADDQRKAAPDLANAHFLAALALLSGRSPGDAVPERIERIENHLEQARAYRAPVVTHQADVLLGLVKDGYYTAHGMDPGPPASDVLAESVAALGSTDLEPLLTHLPHIEGRTWRAVVARAADLGMTPALPAVKRQTHREPDPRRAQAVHKYFVPTPAVRSPVPHLVAFGGALLLAAYALYRMSGFGAFGLTGLVLVGAFLAARFGWRRFRAHRRYARRRDEALPKPTDAQMDAWLREDVAFLVDQAAGRVRLDSRVKKQGGELVFPVQTIVGLPTKDMGERVRMRGRRGDDHLWRANHYDVLALFLTNDVIAVYRCLLDFRTGRPVYEEVSERHYRDIVGVTSNRIPLPPHLAELFRAIDEVHAEAGFEEEDKRRYADLAYAETFALSIVNGDVFELSTGFGEAVGMPDEVAWAENSRALDIIKRMVRARHNPG
ncbi:hypothetical protein [Actinosynnema sp. NPDC020468]|uniref:hypothetical protein n=1 Tax=Actinosynnema sp. NPDC020468 TaxID=3154488 RepID=UPI0033CA9E86